MSGPKPPGPMATFLSDIQLLLSGVALVGAGVGFVLDPVVMLAKLKPATDLIEARVPQVGPYPVCKGISASLTNLGCVLFLVGFLMLMSLYSNDEKFKRNSTPTRVIAGAAFGYVCLRTPHGTSLHALLGLFFGVTGTLNALTVGLGDGNAVDLEIAAERKRRLAAQKSK